MADRILQEDGASRLTLEDASGFLLKEVSGVVETPTPGGALAGGTSPNPQISVSPGGAVAGGTGPSVQIPVTPGGAIAGGFDANDSLDPPFRVSQLPVEGLVQPVPSARLSQEPVETLVLPSDPDARLSQLPVEALVLLDPDFRLSQFPVEVLHRVLYEDIYIAVID